MRSFAFTWSMWLSTTAWAGPHAEQAMQFGVEADSHRVRSAPTSSVMPPPPVSRNQMVYGYQAYWDDDLNAVPWHALSHIALFAAEVDTDGDLSFTSRWDEAQAAVALAEPYGVDVHLCVINFDTSELETLLGDPGARSNLITNLQSWVTQVGAHGVNIDFEGLPSSRRSEMVQFVIDLEAAVGDVVLATPAVDWSDAWDYATLSAHSDLFIMGYGYHWSGSADAGPTDPLYSGSGTPFSAPWSLSWTTDDYLAKGADPSRVILGLPLYGLAYPVSSNDVPTANLGWGTSVFMAEGIGAGQSFGAQYESGTHSPYTYDGSDQIWYPDNDSVLERVEFAVEAGLGGVGFWALHYDDDDPDLWQGVADLTQSEAGTGTGTGTGSGTQGSAGLVADAGTSVVAEIGDTVVLSGVGSTGPEPLSFIWTQVQGPTVQLSDPYSERPRFLVEEGGVHVFELVVLSGVAASEPSTVQVTVVLKGCGCHVGPASGAGGLGWLLLGLWARRRSRGPRTCSSTPADDDC